MFIYLSKCKIRPFYGHILRNKNTFCTTLYPESSGHTLLTQFGCDVPAPSPTLTLMTSSITSHTSHRQPFCLVKKYNVSTNLITCNNGLRTINCPRKKGNSCHTRTPLLIFKINGSHIIHQRKKACCLFF